MSFQNLLLKSFAAAGLATAAVSLTAADASAQERREVFRACCSHADISVPTANGCDIVDDGVKCADDQFVANCSDAEASTCWPIQDSAASTRFSAPAPGGRGDRTVRTPGVILQAD